MGRTIRNGSSEVDEKKASAANLISGENTRADQTDRFVGRIMALGRLLVTPVENSVYYNRGIIWI